MRHCEQTIESEIYVYSHRSFGFTKLKTLVRIEDGKEKENNQIENYIRMYDASAEDIVSFHARTITEHWAAT